MRSDRPSARLLLGLFVLALGLAGCAVVTDPADLAPEEYVEDPEIAPEAIDAFGRDGVGTAFELATDFALAHAFEAPLLDPAQPFHQLAELTLPILPHLSPDARSVFPAQVAAAVAGDPDAQDGLRALTFYGWQEPGWTLPAEGDPVVFEQLTDPTVQLVPAMGDDPERLAVSFVHTARLRFVADGEPLLLEVEKDMLFVMVPTPEPEGPAWLIDAYDGDFSVYGVGA
jgi:hypothetical protein